MDLSTNRKNRVLRIPDSNLRTRLCYGSTRNGDQTGQRTKRQESRGVKSTGPGAGVMTQS
jgi:hypothetical protein